MRMSSNHHHHTFPVVSLSIFFFKGVGIDARHKEIFQRIFEENNESMADNELPDTQIGLNIAAEIVKKMGGIIKVDSRVGEGTEFNVSFI